MLALRISFAPPPTPTTSLSWVSPGPALGCCPRGGNEPPGSSCCLLSPLLHRGTGGGVDRQTDGRTGGCCLLLPQQGWEGARGPWGVLGVPLLPRVSTAPTSACGSLGSPRGPGGAQAVGSVLTSWACGTAPVGVCMGVTVCAVCGCAAARGLVCLHTSGCAYTCMCGCTRVHLGAAVIPLCVCVCTNVQGVLVCVCAQGYGGV